MKKLILLLSAACIALCLSSCGEPPSVATVFDADFTVSRSGEDYSGRLSLTGESLTVAMTAPFTVEGMSFDYTDEGLTISRGGLSASANSDYIPAAAIPSVLHDTLTYIGQAAYIGSDGGEDSFTLPTPYGEATLTARDGDPVRLADDYSGLTFEFSAVR